MTDVSPKPCPHCDTPIPVEPSPSGGYRVPETCPMCTTPLTNDERHLIARAAMEARWDRDGTREYHTRPRYQGD